MLHLHTINDETWSGTSRRIKDYITQKMSKNETDANGKVYVFLVMNKVISFINNQLSGIEQ